MKTLGQSLLFLFWSTLLCGACYTFFITSIGTFMWPKKSQGSLIVQNKTVAGSSLIAQPFKTNKYFWPRPSACDYNTLPSYASNFGPTNKNLAQQINQRRSRQALQNEVDLNLIPDDLVTSSASGLDPHISTAAALIQINRIMKARMILPKDRAKIEQLVAMYNQNHLGFFGEEAVNVLLLNVALDKLQL